jgi:hypothetical protein
MARLNTAPLYVLRRTTKTAVIKQIWSYLYHEFCLTFIYKTKSMHQITNMFKNKVFRHVCDILRGLVRDDVINIAAVIKYILRTFKFGVAAPWG